MDSFRLVEIDETSGFCIDGADETLIEKITTVYLYNDAEVTFACSAEALYYMYPLYNNVYITPEVSEESRERLQDWYGSETGEGGYMAAWRVDPIEGQIRVALAEDQTLDDLIEYYRGNCVL